MPRPLVLILLLAACSPTPEPPPRPPDPSTLDPMVAALVTDRLAAVERAPRDAAARAALALVYQANGMGAQADAAWRQTLALDDDRPRWWYHFAVQRAALGEPAAAADALATAATLDDTYAPIYWRRGFWLLELGRLDEAEAMFREAERRPDGTVAAKIGRARVHLQRGEPDAAAILLEELRAALPDSGYLSQLLGSTYQQLGRFPEAATALRRADGVQPKFADPWAGDVQAVRTGYGAVVGRVDWLVDQGRFDAALADLRELSRSRPDDPVLLAKRGETLLLAGNLTGARDVLEEAIRVRPDYHFAHLHLATVLERQGDLAGALRHVDRVVEIHPGLAPAWIFKADLHRARSEWPAAESALRHAVEAGQRDGDTYVRLAQVQLAQERGRDAEQTLESFLTRHPDDVRVAVALTALRLDRGDLAGAETSLRQAAAVSPQDPEVQRMARELARRRGGGG